MITLEISPEAVKPEQHPAFEMKTDAPEGEWEKTTVYTSPSGTPLGWAKQKKNPTHLVRFFQGKGGFCAIVSNDDVIYFGLPGSRIELNDTIVEIPGEPIQGKTETLLYPNSNTPVQQVTPQAMILGAGLATRFEPISGDTTGLPKPGVPLAGEDSVIASIAKLLKKHGIKTIYINTFYKPDALKRQLAGLQGIELVYIDEDAPSGTAGGLSKALEQKMLDANAPIIIIQGDAITDADLSFLLNTHQQRHAAVTIGGQIVSDRDVHKFGIIETDASGGDGQSGNIVSFKEKPALEEAGPSRFANAGFYILAPEVFPLFLQGWKNTQANQAIYDYAKDFFPLVLDAVQNRQLQDASGQPMGFWAQAVGGYWSDIGMPEQYIEAVHDVYAGRLSLDMPANPADFYENGIIYWPGTKALAQAAQAQLSGNVIVSPKP